MISGYGSKSHLLRFYPLFVQILSFDRCVPVMWVLPSEYKHMFPPPNPKETPNGHDGHMDDTDRLESGDHEGDGDGGDFVFDVDVGDGSELLEVSARDLARRCLEIVGIELGLGPSP